MMITTGNQQQHDEDNREKEQVKEKSKSIKKKKKKAWRRGHWGREDDITIYLVVSAFEKVLFVSGGYNEL